MSELTVGRLVHYRLSAQDVSRINHARLVARGAPLTDQGGRKHVVREGNTPQVGDLVPLLVVRAWPGEYRLDSSVSGDGGETWYFPKSTTGVNGQAFLDGNDTLWVTSAPHGDQPGSWEWPEFKPAAQLSVVSGGSR